MNVKGSGTLLVEGIYIYRPNVDDIQGLEYFETAVRRTDQYQNTISSGLLETST